MKIIKYKFLVVWYHIEILYTKIQLLFNIKKDSSIIPEGHYCYTFNGKNGMTKEGLSWLGTDTCPYFRSMKNMNSACTYIGFIGFDMCHWDQCKICNQNIENEE